MVTWNNMVMCLHAAFHSALTQSLDLSPSHYPHSVHACMHAFHAHKTGNKTKMILADRQWQKTKHTPVCQPKMPNAK